MFTWDSFICICAKTCRKPTTASHRRLWARLCWFPVQGPWNHTAITEMTGLRLRFFPHVEDRPYLNVLCESVEDLFGYIDCFGEIPLALFIDDVFPRVVPVEIADGLLRTRRAHACQVCVIRTWWRWCSRRNRSPGLGADNPPSRWWCWPSCCYPSAFAGSSENLMHGHTIVVIIVM